MQKTGLTYKQLYNECKKFKIGDAVRAEVKNLTRMSTEEEIEEFKNGIVLERYPNHLVIKINEFRQESFTYADIILKKKVKKKLGRKSNHETHKNLM